MDITLHCYLIFAAQANEHCISIPSRTCIHVQQGNSPTIPESTLIIAIAKPSQANPAGEYLIKALFRNGNNERQNLNSKVLLSAMRSIICFYDEDL